MGNGGEYLPFLIPVVILQVVLFVITMIHILTHDEYKNGTRVIWIIVTILGCNYVGPILYWIFGARLDGK